MARITITAADGDNDPVERVLVVTVRAPDVENSRPEVVNGINAMALRVGDDPLELDVSSNFIDPDDDDLTITANSSDISKATVSVSVSTLTITAVAEGMATIAVTASDGRDSVKVRFTVTVNPANMDPVRTEIPDQSLEMDFDEPETLDLSMYFSDPDSGPKALSYVATSSNMYATVAVDGSMLTITAVAAGTATITVTASDSEASAEAMFTVTVTNPAVPTATSEMRDETFEHDDMTPRTVMLSKHFSRATMYVPMSDDENVVTATVEDGLLTLTPVGAGSTMVTVTPSNSGGIGSSQTITVTVEAAPMNNPPSRTDKTVPQVDLTLGTVPSWGPHDVSGYFEDADEDDLMYTATSSMYATADIPDGSSMLTITAKDAGTAPITVTAADGNGGSVDLEIIVTVNSAPTPKAPTWKKEIPNVTFEHNGGPQAFTLEDYFNDATKYVATSADEAVVTADLNEDQTMLTLTRVGVGSTVVEITPSNSGGNGTTQSINVMVKAAPTLPKPPELKPGETIPMDVKVTAITDTDAMALDVTDSADLAMLDAAEESFDLSDLIKDPERADADLEFMTTTSNSEVVAVYADPPVATGAADNNAARAGTTKAMLDKMTTDASHIWIRGRKAGPATVTITASSDSGQSKKWTISVTVATGNTAPEATDNDGSAIAFPGTGVADTDPYRKFVGLNAANRLKLNPTKMWKEKLDLGSLFYDPDVEINARAHW